MRFYTYTYFIDNLPAYVGKGSNERFLDHLQSKGKTYWLRYLNHAIQHNRDVRVDLTVYATEDEAYVAERDLVTKYGRRDLKTGSLFNKCDGGKGGFSGCVRMPVSEETRAKMRAARLGKPLSDKAKAAMSETLKGGRQSLEWKEARLSKIRGRKQSEEAKALMCGPRGPSKLTLEQRAARGRAISGGKLKANAKNKPASHQTDK